MFTEWTLYGSAEGDVSAPFFWRKSRKSCRPAPSRSLRFYTRTTASLATNRARSALSLSSGAALDPGSVGPEAARGGFADVEPSQADDDAASAMASNTEFAWQVASTSISKLPSASVLYHAPRGNSSRRGDGVCRCLRVAGVLLVQLHRRHRAFGAAARCCLLSLPRPRKALPALSQRWAWAGATSVCSLPVLASPAYGRPSPFATRSRRLATSVLTHSLPTSYTSYAGPSPRRVTRTP